MQEYEMNSIWKLRIWNHTWYEINPKHIRIQTKGTGHTMKIWDAQHNCFRGLKEGWKRKCHSWYIPTFPFLLPVFLYLKPFPIQSTTFSLGYLSQISGLHFRNLLPQLINLLITGLPLGTSFLFRTLLPRAAILAPCVQEFLISFA